MSMSEKTMQQKNAAGGFHREIMRRRARYTTVFLCLIAALIIITVLNIKIGNVSISGKEILQILFTRAGEDTAVNIIWLIRLPRVAMAFLLGGALALAGFAGFRLAASAQGRCGRSEAFRRHGAGDGLDVVPHGQVYADAALPDGR